jgi:hypothetical protein
VNVTSLKELAEVLDRAFDEDWEIDQNGTPIVRRKQDASNRRHHVWTLYRWLKQRWRGDLMKFEFPMEGDGMPSHPGSPRRWKWKTGNSALNPDDFKFLTGGPLLGLSDELLVPGTTAHQIEEDMRPPALETEIAEHRQHWTFQISDGSGQIILVSPPARPTRLEVLYMLSKDFSASEQGICYVEPMDREYPRPIVGPRKYYLAEEWRLDPDAAAHLTEGPLYHRRSKRELIAADTGQAKRVFIDEIDSFQQCRDAENWAVEQLLKDGLLRLSEPEVKKAIHSILGDPEIQKDWGGERSDIFTTQFEFRGQRYQAAMVLKGPSVGKHVSIADQGKKGDQIVRLFEQAADFFVVQANGVFEPTLVKHVQQTAVSQNRELYYCLIDGRDTARMLVGYGFHLLGDQ